MESVAESKSEDFKQATPRNAACRTAKTVSDCLIVGLGTIQHSGFGVRIGNYSFSSGILEHTFSFRLQRIKAFIRVPNAHFIVCTAVKREESKYTVASVECWKGDYTGFFGLGGHGRSHSR